MKDVIAKAIAAHGEWKLKFQDFMQGKVDFDPAVLQQANRCEFGKWLEHDGEQALGISVFTEVDTLHAKFHKAAADVARKKKSGDVQAARMSLQASGEFTVSSTALVHKLMEIGL